ncbi:hypothetical protein WA026_006466 [Henosepilachna vigintioctopunctata]
MQPLRNASEVQFEAPKVPVIFVLGGPGSGKVTHCDNLMQENKGITHINMTDLLQQYAIGNDMKDFGVLSSRTVTEVLMLEMKMAPKAKTYLISGYPRNMRDVVEYSEKIQTTSGAILISWRQKVLERQIDYGAKLGQVVLSLARMELNNFYKNVIPVADYFDQSNILITVNGERHPSEVYADFKSSIFKILGEQDNPPVFANGKVAPVPNDVSNELPTRPSLASISQAVQSKSIPVETERPKTQVISVNSNNPNAYPTPVKNEWPPVVWVIGGPGSNKAMLCAQAAEDTGWSHVSLGKLLRAAAEPPDHRRNPEANRIKECISSGEMVPLDIVLKYVEANMATNLMVPGIILDGFPRDMHQVTEFEAKFKQKPTIVLLDCSKLQLGRGRLDDSVTAFRRRLEIFRQSSLPMLKTMDQIGRLTIVDGDTDTPAVQQDFRNVIRDFVDYIKTTQSSQTPPHHSQSNGHTVPIQNGSVQNGSVQNTSHETEIEDLESDVPNSYSPHEARNGYANGSLKNISNGISNGVKHMGNGYDHAVNGHGPKKKIEKLSNGVAPSFASLASDGPPAHSEMNHMDAHI